MRICLFIEYDGTNYCGWQRQKNGVSIQECIENAIKEITREECDLHGSGRTDAGVHAYKQIAHFDTHVSIEAQKYLLALNTNLPCDIRIIKSFEVSQEFHSRFSAKKKHYRYIICNRSSASAVFAKYSMHVPQPLDIYAMKRGGGNFVGTHDFKSFCSTRTTVKDTVRSIFNVSVVQVGEFIHIDVIGNGFLHNMVRIIAGTLIRVGLGKIKPFDIPLLLKSQDRTKAGITAQAQGLFLVDVEYEEFDAD